MLPLVTLVVVFCYITSRITTHMGGNDDPEHYITSVSYTCLRVGCILESGSRTVQPEKHGAGIKQRQRQTQLRAPRDRKVIGPRMNHEP